MCEPGGKLHQGCGATYVSRFSRGFRDEHFWTRLSLCDKFKMQMRVLLLILVAFRITYGHRNLFLESFCSIISLTKILFGKYFSNRLTYSYYFPILYPKQLVKFVSLCILFTTDIVAKNSNCMSFQLKFVIRTIGLLYDSCNDICCQ